MLRVSRTLEMKVRGYLALWDNEGDCQNQFIDDQLMICQLEHCNWQTILKNSSTHSSPLRTISITHKNIPWWHAPANISISLNIAHIFLLLSSAAAFQFFMQSFRAPSFIWPSMGSSSSSATPACLLITWIVLAVFVVSGVFFPQTSFLNWSTNLHDKK